MDDFFKNLTGKKTNNNLFDEVVSQNEKEKNEKALRAEIQRLRTLISSQLASRVQNMNLFGNKDPEQVAQVREMIWQIVGDSNTFLHYQDRKTLTEDMVKEITSLGKIHHLIEDADITEVMVNAYDEVWAELDGKLVRTDTKFREEEEVLNLARKIANHIGRRVDTASPTVDARLPDGSRVHIIIPPLAMKGTTITIRKFKQEKLGIQDLINFGSISPQAAHFIVGAVKARANIVVSGGTGSGKTTTLNILSNAVPNDERIITIEDSAELQLYNEHVVRLESRPPNAEGHGEYTIRELIKDSLRMRPDRIIVGEVRDGSAFDLMQACNTGHDGSMGTVHANNPDACTARLDNLILQAGYALPSRAIRELIAQSVDLIVQIQRLSDGSRKITHISHVKEYDRATESVVTEDIFIFKLTGVKNKKLQGEFVYTGYVPPSDFIVKFQQHDLDYEELVKGGDL